MYPRSFESLFKIHHRNFEVNRAKYHKDLDEKSLRFSQDPIKNSFKDFPPKTKLNKSKTSSKDHIRIISS